MQLNLTIDLPPTDYNVTDKLSPTQQVIEALMTIFSSILLILAAVGWAMIYTVNGVGNVLQWLIDAPLCIVPEKTAAGSSRSGQVYRAIYTSRALDVIDGWAIALLTTLVSLVLGRGTVYATA